MNEKEKTTETIFSGSKEKQMTPFLDVVSVLLPERLGDTSSARFAPSALPAREILQSPSILGFGFRSDSENFNGLQFLSIITCFSTLGNSKNEFFSKIAKNV